MHKSEIILYWSSEDRAFVAIDLPQRHKDENRDRKLSFTAFWSASRSRPIFLRMSFLSMVTTLARRTSVGFGSPVFFHSCKTTSETKLRPRRWLVIMATT